MREVSTNSELDVSQLKAWLEPSAQAIDTADLRFLLGADGDALPSASAIAMPFVLAVLRDIYADDDGVLHWLTRERSALSGSSAIDMLVAGRIDEVETLLVRQWNQPRTFDGRLRYVRKVRIT